MLPMAAVEPLRAHLQEVRAIHRRDLANGLGRVWLPCALERKYPNAAIEWGWQCVAQGAIRRSAAERSLHGRRSGNRRR